MQTLLTRNLLVGQGIWPEILVENLIALVELVDLPVAAASEIESHVGVYLLFSYKETVCQSFCLFKG